LYCTFSQIVNQVSSAVQGLKGIQGTEIFIKGITEEFPVRLAVLKILFPCWTFARTT